MGTTHSQTCKMLQLLSLAGLMAALSQGIPMQSPECCDSKDVGGVSYSLVGQMDTTAYQCLNNCVYVKDQDPTVKFCFASGDLQVECTKDEFQGSDKPPMGGSDKPPMSGSDKPPMEGTDKPPTEAPAGQQEGESCGSCFCPPAFTAGECEEGLTCVRDPMIPDLPGKCTKPAKKEGESCGSCLCPPTYSAGDCEEGLACVYEPGIADAPGSALIIQQYFLLLLPPHY